MRILLVFSLLLVSLPEIAVSVDAPTSVVAYAPNQNRVHVTWIDNADDETGYKVERQVDGGSWVNLTSTLLPANFEVYRGEAVSNAEQTYRFRITAVKGAEEASNESQTLLKPTGPLDLFHDPNHNDPSTGQPPRELPEGSSARAGFAVNQNIPVFNGTPTSYDARDLAPGLSLDTNTGAITGTVTTPGVYRMFTGVVFDTDKRFEQVRFLRVLPGVSTPVVNQPINLPEQHIGVNGFLDITTLFKDPARPKGAWFYTAGVSIIVALYDSATPKTVDNFMGYVNRGDYNNTYIHRTASSVDPNTFQTVRFIIQGGGYVPASSTAPPTSWKSIQRRDNIQNEPGISNARRTISMAKLPERDGASSEWFFNTGDSNPANLDYQSGGFTAFGEVVGQGGLNVVDQINDLPVGNYSGVISGVGVPPSALTNVPVLDTVAPVTPGANSLLRIDSITPVPPVVITLVSNSNPNVLAAGVTGTLLYIESKGPIGTANLLLRATNADGNSVDFNLPIRIDDLLGPGFKLTNIRGVAPPGSLLVRGLAQDGTALGYWRYRINRGRWIKAQTLTGKKAPLTVKMKGFRKGKNLIEFEVFDARRNSSGVLKQTLTFS